MVLGACVLKQVQPHRKLCLGLSFMICFFKLHLLKVDTTHYKVIESLANPLTSNLPSLIKSYILLTVRQVGSIGLHNPRGSNEDSLRSARSCAPPQSTNKQCRCPQSNKTSAGKPQSLVIQLHLLRRYRKPLKNHPKYLFRRYLYVYCTENEQLYNTWAV